MKNNPNIIFYSKSCKTCANLFQMLETERLLKYFKLKCLDKIIDIVRGISRSLPPPNNTVENAIRIAESTVRDKSLLNDLKILKGIGAVPAMLTSKIAKTLVGNETFKWIEQMKFIKQKRLSQLKKDTGPIGWSNDEMNRLSDNFAYTDNKIPEQKYFKLNAEKEIFTPPAMISIKKHEQKKLLDQSRQVRTHQEEQYKNAAKQYHIKVLQNANKNKHLSNTNHRRR